MLGSRDCEGYAHKRRDCAKGDYNGLAILGSERNKHLYTVADGQQESVGTTHWCSQSGSVGRLHRDNGAMGTTARSDHLHHNPHSQRH